MLASRFDASAGRSLSVAAGGPRKGCLTSSTRVRQPLRMNRREYDAARVRSLHLTIQNLVKRRREIDGQIRLLVLAAVKEGTPWREIGSLLGTSGQAAWEKYRPGESPKING